MLGDEAPGFVCHLDNMLHDPGTVALIAVAPASLVRDFRSLCWMLALPPPPHLARPRPARPKPAKAPRAPRKRTRPWRPSVPPPLGTTPAEPPRAPRRKIPA
jgi:hypothetical protein